jgi:hypothetical protein
VAIICRQGSVLVSCEGGQGRAGRWITYPTAALWIKGNTVHIGMRTVEESMLSVYKYQVISTSLPFFSRRFKFFLLFK